MTEGCEACVAKIGELLAERDALLGEQKAWRVFTEQANATVDKAEAERDTLQNKVYELEHVIQHWEVDAEYWKIEKEDLTAERDALKAEHSDLLLAFEDDENQLAELRADNERLRAEVAPNWKQGYANMADGVLALEAQLTELREATEAHVRVCPSLDGRTWLEDVLAKVTP